MYQFENEVKGKHLTSSASGYALLNEMKLEDDDELEYLAFKPLSPAPNDGAFSVEAHLLDNSPTKPLNFPHHKIKEFNSSSDTYNSDHDDSKPMIIKEENLGRNFSFDDSLEVLKTVQTTLEALARAADSAQFEAATTHDSPAKSTLPIGALAMAMPVPIATTSVSGERHSVHEDDDFSFGKTPFTSAVDLSPQKDRTTNNESPSKSIMKKNPGNSTPFGSPTKKVVFALQIPQVHTYKKDETATEDEYTPLLQQLELPLDTWNAVLRDAISSDDDEDAPAPPPHSVVPPRLALSDDEDEQEVIDKKKLEEFKLHHKSTSNISLNEKLDVFLSSNPQLKAGSESGAAEELDTHLNNLEAAKARQTQSNIHNLSLNLQTQKLDEIENPLNSLSRSGDVELDSGNTSRSSIQSLKDDERVLRSQNISTVVQGIALNDGIKGFSDHTVESLLPPPQPAAGDIAPQLPKFGLLEKQLSGSSNEVFHDSFDQNYDNTEQRIMDLLGKKEVVATAAAVAAGTLGAAALGLSSSGASSKPLTNHAATEAITKNAPTGVFGHDGVKIKHEDDDHVSIKQEDEDVYIKQEIKEEDISYREKEEVPNHVNETAQYVSIPRLESAKTDISYNGLSVLPNLKVDLEHIHNHPTEIVSVSGYASASASTDMLGGVRLVNNNLNEDHEAKDEDADEEYDSVHERSKQFSIRDHIDEDWKFEDSNDGDREDNDEYTNNETHETILTKTVEDVEEEDEQIDSISKKSTVAKPKEVNEISTKQVIVSDHENSIDVVKKEVKKTMYKITDTPRKRLLEVNLSPNVSADELAHSESTKSLAPPRIESPIKSPIQSGFTTPLEIDQLPAPTISASIEPRQLFPEKKLSDDEEIQTVNWEKNQNQNATRVLEEEALANSSNIGINEDITLPPIETNNYSSFEELARTLDKSLAFEESLSAENDPDSSNPNGFLNIWRSQNKARQYQQPADLQEEYEILQRNIQFPGLLQAKTFKEVNVINRRVISPGFEEELNVSGFLPELSQDSGFEDHFKGIVQEKDSSTNEDVSESYGSVIVGSRESQYVPKDFLTPTYEVTPISSRLMPPKSTFKPVSVKKSQFRVPSFEIKRSNSVLSPKNQYNDEIYADTVQARRALKQLRVISNGQPPTIKSNGMKTLPSMDRDDVQKILNTKRIISQEEYSRIKLVGNKKKDNLIEPISNHEHLQASIHDYEYDYDSADITPTTLHQQQARSGSQNSEPRRFASAGDGRVVAVDNSILPHLADELLKVPNSLLSKDQYFKESEIYGGVTREADPNLSTSLPSQTSRSTSVIVKKNTLAPKTSQLFPDPDPELLHDIFKSSGTPKMNLRNAQEDFHAQQRLLNYRGERTSEPSTPIRKSAKKDGISTPIKIGSPVRLVKNNGSISAVASPKRAKESYFTGNDLNNAKLRDDGSGIFGEPAESASSRRPIETVNIPSLSTVGSEITGSSAQLTAVSGNSRKVSGDSLGASTIISKPSLSERGKLFLRVVGVKNLDLPEIESKKAKFTMTLDNGVHCIKTPTYDLSKRNISIGKEFELTVPEGGLEFILTMKASYDKPKGGLKEVHERKVVKSKNRFSRLLGSKDVITTTSFVPVEVNDSWANKFAQDGSFARCYVDMEQYEGKIIGKVSNFDITCFNEWETVLDSKGERVKCKPYRIGQLEVKMLFVPRTLQQEVLPSSIKAAYESVNLLRYELSLYKEGYMHQEGGDCNIWKKRFFKLQGTSLIAHSEFSHKTRAKINLAKLVEVIYVDKENSAAQGNYRNFSDVLLLEHSFKIRFGNGEVIDFGAPNKEEKKEWIMIIERIIQRNKFRVQPWVKIMLECNNIQQFS